MVQTLAATRPESAGRRKPIVMPKLDFSGLVILVVEDDYYLAEELCLGLQDAGAQVLGPAPSVVDAMQVLAMHPKPDAAVLDVSLNGEVSWPIVDVLLALKVPVVLASGYEDFILPARYTALPRCVKPFMLTTLTNRLIQHIAESASGALA